MKRLTVLLLFVLIACQKEGPEPQKEAINLSLYEGNYLAYKVYFLAVARTESMPYAGMACRLAVLKNNTMLNFEMRKIKDGKDVEKISMPMTYVGKEDLALQFSDGKNKVRITDAEILLYIYEETTYYYFKR